MDGLGGVLLRWIAQLVSLQHRGIIVWPGTATGDTMSAGGRRLSVPTRTAPLWRTKPNPKPITPLGMPHLLWTSGILLYRSTGELYTQLFVKETCEGQLTGEYKY